jgi:hypothetical protein
MTPPGAGPICPQGFYLNKLGRHLHAKYLSSSSLDFLKVDFLKFLLYTYEEKQYDGANFYPRAFN